MWVECSDWYGNAVAVNLRKADEIEVIEEGNRSGLPSYKTIWEIGISVGSKDYRCGKYRTERKAHAARLELMNQANREDKQ